MESSTKNVFTTGNAPSKDWFLQFLVNMANKNNFELDITLTVGGFLISGTLTSVRRYFDELGEYFAGPLTTGSHSEDVLNTFKKIGHQCSCVTPSEQSETPSYIHLRNARFYDSRGKLASGEEASEPTWWRGRLSEIQGFAPGKRLG